MCAAKNVAVEILKFAKSKLNGPQVIYGKKGSGKCEELVKAALEYADAEQGLKIITPSPGDIAAFKEHIGKITIDIHASNKPGESTIIEGVSDIFKRFNHIGIVSTTPDANGKIYLFEQNVGQSKKVVQSPIYIKAKVSYDKRYSSITSYTSFKNELSRIVKEEFTDEKGNQALKTIQWAVIKKWFDIKQNYAFTIKVSYSENGVVEFYRPREKTTSGKPVLK